MERVNYIPSTQYTDAKYTVGGEFLEKLSGKDFRGYYIETSRNTFFSGQKPEDNGIELIKIPVPDTSLTSPVFNLLVGFFAPKLKKGDLTRGFFKRYFAQDSRTGKIVETDRESYLKIQDTPSTKAAEIVWHIKAPAEDLKVNGYKYEGSISKNKKTVEELNKIIPGASTFITDYALLVQSFPEQNSSTSYKEARENLDPDVILENERKANFDKKD